MSVPLPSAHDSFLRQAFTLAAKARSNGNHPFGALLVVSGAVVLTAENSVTTEGNDLCHAEMNLVSLACRDLSLEDRARAILYTSTEPCAMCSGAIYWSGIRTVVFACSSETLGAYAGRRLPVGCREIFDRGVEGTSVIGPRLEDEAADLHRGFWS